MARENAFFELFMISKTEFKNLMYSQPGFRATSCTAIQTASIIYFIDPNLDKPEFPTK